MKRLVTALLPLVLLAVCSSSSFSSDINIARGCPVTLNPAPNYENTGNHPASLTDGIYTTGRLWHQDGTVGWIKDRLDSITVDLGKLQPISGISFSTAAGDDAVQWPASILIWVSDDRVNWRCIGDLLPLSDEYGQPPAKGYANYCYVTHDLKARGRYLRLSIFAGGNFTFCDELEVYKGSDDLLASPVKGAVVKDGEIERRAREFYFSNRIIYRLGHDADAVRAAVKASKISDAEKSRLYKRLDDISEHITEVTERNSDKFEAVLPINAKDAAIFSVYGSLLKSRGLPTLFAWKKDRYDYLSPTEVPSHVFTPSEVGVRMMKNEYRSDALMLTAASEEPQDVSVSVRGIPGAPKPGWLSISAMPWTDTAPGTPIAAALPPMEYRDGAYKARIPAGMTTKLWITVDSSKLGAGSYHGIIDFKGPGREFIFPLNIYVSQVKMNRPRLSFAAWDYCFQPGRYAVTAKNMGTAMATMRTHFVDTPWACPEDVPMPAADSFDAAGNLVKPLAFGDFDRWIHTWPEARHYILFLNAKTEMGGAPMGSDEFSVRVGNWVKALVKHSAELGIKPEKLGIMVRDEPGEESQKVIIAWAKVIKAAQTGVVVFQDCDMARPDRSQLMSKALDLADISCPMIDTYYKGGPETESYFNSLQASDHKMWLYQCEGPAHLLDPYRYHRLEAWHCFKHGAIGMGLWAFGDTGAFKSSWNEYSCMSNEYSPVFLRPTDINSGIHWEAVREGIEDYEYLSMLNDASANTHNAALKAQSEALLKESVDAVLKKFNSAAERWNRPDDRTKADEYRLKILDLLDFMEICSTK